METPISDLMAQHEPDPTMRDDRLRRKRSRAASGRLLDLKAAEIYSGISAWTLRDLIASGDLPVVRPPRLRRIWIDRADLDRAIAEWKERGAG